MSARWVIVIFGAMLLAVLVDIVASNWSFTYAYMSGRCSAAPLPPECAQSSYFGIPRPEQATPAPSPVPAAQ